MIFVSENADREQLAQLQILNKAQQRQIEDLERKLEDSRRNMRYLEHQFVIVKGMFNFKWGTSHFVAVLEQWCDFGDFFNTFRKNI